MSKFLAILTLYLLTSCSAMGVVRDTAIIAGASALGGLGGPALAAAGGGGAYLALEATEGKILEEDVHDAALNGGGWGLPPVFAKYGVLILALLVVFFIQPGWIGTLLSRAYQSFINIFKHPNA